MAKHAKQIFLYFGKKSDNSHMGRKVFGRTTVGRHLKSTLAQKQCSSNQMKISEMVKHAKFISLYFGKKSDNYQMGRKIHFKFLKLEQWLLKFRNFLERLDNIIY